MVEGVRHWDDIFQSRRNEELSWFEAEPATSLRLLQQWSPQTGSIVDVGAGRSCLVDRLLDEDWTDVTVLDLSEVALRGVRGRLASRASAVSFVVEDVRSWQPERSFSIWHDRAVFHFLVAPEDRERYIRVVTRALIPGGVLIVATFALDGPTQCSGLPVVGYGPDELARVFESSFTLEHAEREEHKTSSGSVQPFTWVVLRKR